MMKKILRVLAYILIIGGCIHAMGVIGYSDAHLPPLSYTFIRLLWDIIIALFGALLYKVSEVIK